MRTRATPMIPVEKIVVEEGLSARKSMTSKPSIHGVTAAILIS
jgi:hypothetical protein